MHSSKNRKYGLYISSLMAVSLASVGQWVFFPRNDIIENKLPLFVVINNIGKEGLYASNTIVPAYHFIVPAAAFAVCCATHKLIGNHRIGYSLFPRMYHGFFGFIAFSAICCMAHVITTTGKIGGLSYGMLPAAMHMMLALIYNLWAASDNWSFLNDRLDSVSSSHSIEAKKLLCSNVGALLKIANRSTILLAVSATIGVWGMLGNGAVVDGIAVKYYVINILFNFFVTCSLIAVLVLFPIFRIGERAGEIYMRSLMAIPQSGRFTRNVKKR